ncbi:MAG: CPBP family intramembrane metalloprotease [Candidatus Bathyarchaeota archaeon]|nr:CPBP family intramembrane metalloprotease [Candidatus Bathyarchaeota archaeon]
MPDALAKNGLIPSSLLTELGFIGAFGPLVSALILTAVYEGKKGIVHLLKSAVDYRFSKRWWIVVFFLFPLLVIAAFFMGVLTDGVVPFSQVFADPLFLFPAFFSVLFLSGPFEEEFGWRGYALPRLQARFSALVSSLILGFFWAIWHIPQFLIPGNGMFYKTPILTFIPTVIAATVIFTWVYNNTHGSLLAMLLLHTTFNLAMFTFPVLDTSTGYIYVLAVFTVTATFVAAFSRSPISNSKA